MKQLKRNGTGMVSYLDIIWCTVRYGASPNNYRDFEFQNLNKKERGTYVTNGLSRKMIKKFNDSSYVQIFENKKMFAEKFSDYFGRTWITTADMTYESFLKFIESKEKFIYKPIENAQGQGIKVFGNLKNPRKVFDSIRELKEEAILEEWILQHPLLDTVYNKAINCLRIITLSNSNDIKFLAGGVTWGNGEQIANASASGIVSPVNFENGVLEKPAADFSGKLYKRHPITGVDLIGLQLPYWNQVKKMINNAAREIPQVAYIGWDIAITPCGVVLIEGNTTPGYRYYQIPVHMDNKLGNRAIYESCLKKL